ncbi:ADP-ribosylglycohydrolase family protein [Planctomicrobium piriforme]|uniref:ADP-ribosylglycohydrolase n=1 Tax=Planctomicrobium piriforme TaxID=1576369 RepID=A0A1I3G3U0_9PLAN|nr:ADP-ribosylglycohydrolase family protein [Planctomicrobium piriforme]SFI18124.1 ADP-ribosylglycohydrolase [Planctomicrobium piriforme]
MQSEALAGCLIGTAVGDALGLPYEGLAPRRAQRLLGPPDRYRFLFGHGMVSDDTDHACLVAQSLIAAGGDSAKFQRELARRLRWWLAALPAGVGLATARAIFRLWLGFKPERSGVFSAGNGPAMRSPLLGVAIEDPQQLRDFVRRNTRLTHTDPKAEWGALAVAIAARISSRAEVVDPAGFLRELKTALQGEPTDDLLTRVEQAVAGLSTFQSVAEFAASQGCGRGVSGYVNHTVPVAIHAWLRFPDNYAAAVQAVVECGGDTDTTAAITGGIVGARVGVQGIPAVWRERLCEWPRTLFWMERLARQLSDPTVTSPPEVCWTAIVPRNLFFLACVLTHGVRRLLRPY